MPAMFDSIINELNHATIAISIFLAIGLTLMRLALRGRGNFVGLEDERNDLAILAERGDTTQGTITDKTASYRRSMLDPKMYSLTYRYEASGKRRTGMFRVEDAAMHKMFGENPVGVSIDITYDPHQPERSYPTPLLESSFSSLIHDIDFFSQIYGIAVKVFIAVLIAAIGTTLIRIILGPSKY